MKRGIVLILGLILATITSASVSTNFKKLNCRESLAKIDETLSLAAQIEQDLIRGVWIQGNQNSFQTLSQFTETGTATFLHAVGMGPVYEAGRYAWHVEVINEDPVLVLRNQRTQEIYRLIVEQTCEGMTLVNVSTGQMQEFTYLPSSREQQSRREAALTGIWANVLPSVTLTSNCPEDESSKIKMEQVSFQFEFRKDGTFSRRLSSKKGDIRFEEEGRWEVSKDGKKLLLYCTDTSGNTITQCANIKYLEMDELVLEQPLSLVGRRFASMENDDLFFNKQ